MSNVKQSRINKTIYFYEDRQGFMNTLVKNINSLKVKAKNRGLIPLIRLNGTSDIKWENIEFIENGIKYNNIFDRFPELQFYDYSKMYSRSNHSLKNYHVTLSAGKNTTTPAISRMLHSGNNVAVVFRAKNSNNHIFIMGKKWPLVNGDDTDLRFLDPVGVVVALTAKGKARKDYSGFVREVPFMTENYGGLGLEVAV